MKTGFSILLMFVAIHINANWSKFVEGAYCDWEGKVHQGYIEVVSGEEIKFKTAEDAERIVLDPRQVKSFTIEGNEFLVISDFSVEPNSIFERGNLSKVFVNQVHTGKIKLFKYRMLAYNGMVTNSGMMYDIGSYYFVQKDDGEILQVPEKKKAFRAFFKSLLHDNADLVSKVGDKVLEFDDLQEIVELYNSN